MSDFVPRDILPDLWEEILQRHWTFLETEESMQKLEERKKLEGCLKEFLCIVPHDRKFFLPETAHVLKKSIKEMDDFSAYKAMIGFESISQYANNLFTKPWRKEYRVIKMYSGFYHHEIKSNLIDADKLFEAMGYRQLPNQILMLDGPICPDQVTNVSRDAMAAYVECQIMKQIFSGLTSLQLSCSWLDIFNYRETHIGGASQAVKSIACAVQERRFRKEKLNPETCYATIQHTQQQQQQMNPSCPTCVHSCHSQIPQIGNSCGMHHMAATAAQQQNYSGMCNIHPQHQTQNIYMHNNVPVPLHYKPQNYGPPPPPQMSHSKSLEHYSDVVPAGVLPHRHSFDQPTYDGTYDCVDSYQSCNFNAYNHPYNVSGNRYPLPYNISAQLNNQFSGCTGTNHYPPTATAAAIAAPAVVPPPPSLASCGHKIASSMQQDQMYGECNGYSKKTQDICNYHSNKDLINYRQCAYAPTNSRNNMNSDQLIDFDDRTNDSTNIIHHNRLHNNSFEYNDRISYDQTNRSNKLKSQPQYDIPKFHHTNNITNPSQKDLYNRNVDSSDDIDGNYLYSGNRGDKKSTITKRNIDKYSRNAEILEQYEKVIDNNEIKLAVGSVGGGGGGGADVGVGVHHDSYDSFEDILAIDGSDSTVPSKTISNKNQDGVGSFESWDYVFQNLEKHGYKKDLGERGDLLVQGLDLDSMKISGPGEKRRSRNMENKLKAAPSDNVKSKTLEKTDLTKESSNKTKLSTDKVTSLSLRHDDDNLQKSVMKVNQVQKSQQQQQQQQKIKSGKTVNNNYDQGHSINNVERKSTNRTNVIATASAPAASAVPSLSSHHRSINTGPSKINGRTSMVAGSTGIATSTPATTATTTITNIPIIIASSPNEWSCRFCTYLNPDTRRICEMCCRSKDFVLDATNPTCV